MKVFVIYYDGNEYHAVEAETDYPDSAMPHVYGLDDDFQIIAVVANPGKNACVFIEEQCVLGERP